MLNVARRRARTMEGSPPARLPAARTANTRRWRSEPVRGWAMLRVGAMRHILGAVLTLSLLLSSACAGQPPSVQPGKSPGADVASDALDRGLQAHAQGRLDDAAKAYRETLVQDPQNKYAYYNLG